MAADHLLKHISSNPLITRPRDGSGQRPQSLVTYLQSLRATREMDVQLVLPGHGDPISDHRSLIDEAYLTLSEVLGHVDMLLNAGRAREVTRDRVSVFEAG